MTMNITGTEITSDATPHTARAWPVPGEPTMWSVTWLPSRALTRNQAITAMTIAETTAAHTGTLDNASARWRPFLESWAAELGLSAEEATELASEPPACGEARHQGGAQAAPVRANEVGSPCPQWCTTPHFTRDLTVRRHSF